MSRILAISQWSTKIGTKSTYGRRRRRRTHQNSISREDNGHREAYCESRVHDSEDIPGLPYFHRPRRRRRLTICRIRCVTSIHAIVHKLEGGGRRRSEGNNQTRMAVGSGFIRTGTEVVLYLYAHRFRNAWINRPCNRVPNWRPSTRASFQSSCTVMNEYIIRLKNKKSATVCSVFVQCLNPRASNTFL